MGGFIGFLRIIGKEGDYLGKCSQRKRAGEMNMYILK